MNVLLLGSGGRESALAWKISQSKQCSELFIAPGNGGTAQFGKNIPIQVTDFESIASFCLEKNIEIVVVGPEDPLVKGISDFFKSKENLSHIIIIGPDSKGAQLEGSKAFSKAFMQKYNIPTAAYKSFNSEQIVEAKEFLRSLESPYVIKADGLAAGKGVVICNNLDEADKAIDSMLLNKIFGEAGSNIVIEEFMHGIEMSVFVLSDGKNYIVLPDAKDYKRIGNNDTGLNTGGMGTASPVTYASESLHLQIENDIIKPTIEGLIREGINYVGFIFLGLMNVKGKAKVIEYNVRLGDPETQSIMPRIKSDILEIFYAVKDQKLNEVKIEIDEKSVVNIVLASEGYPGNFEKNKEIKLPECNENQIVFQAGTKDEGAKLLTNGGRVLTACGLGDNLEEAIKNAYELAEKIEFENKYYRTDIGQDLIKFVN